MTEDPKDNQDREAADNVADQSAGEKATPVKGDESPGYEGTAGPAVAWERDLDVYPLRRPEEDPRWAMAVFWLWVIFCSTVIVLMTVWNFYTWWFD